MSNIRLTLRTLLAYLDDTLPVSEARIIGAKLAENPETNELVERIRKVIRKRSLPVPSTSTDGSASDPNTVAEYLSDALKSEQLSQFETICLDQDIHLAEVAACHQILTLVLCEQVRIPPTARQRMYQLVKGRESIPNRKPGATIPIVGVLDESDATDTEEYDESLLMGMGSSQQNSVLPKMGLKIGLIAALAVLFGVALWMTLPPSRTPDAVGGYALLTVPTTTSPPKKVETPPTKKPDPSTPSTTKAPEVTPPTGKGADIAAMPKPMVPEGPPTEPPIPTPMPLPNDPRPMLNPPKKDLVPPAPAPKQDRVQLGKTDDGKAIVVKKNPVANAWVRILPEDPMFISTDKIMALPGYKAPLKFDSDVTVELWGNLRELLDAPILEAAITPYLPADGVDVDLLVHTGRLYFSTKKKTGAKIVLRFRSELWELTLKDDKTEVVFELFLSLVPGTADIARATVGLSVMEGSMILKDRYQPEATIQKGGEAQWDSKEGLTRISPLPAPNLTAQQKAFRNNYLARLPLYPPSARPNLQALAEFAQQLTEPKQVRGVFDAALSDRPELATNEQAKASARIAILAFAALGDAQGLGDALNDPSRTLLRQVAIVGLRNALASQPELGPAFRQVLVEKNRVGDEAADRVMQLLRGVSPTQRQVAETFDKLLVGLGSTSVAVRELSMGLLVENYLRPDDKNLQALLNFDAGAPMEIREAAIGAWAKRAEELKNRAAEAPKESKR